MALNVPLLQQSLELVLERRPDFTPRFYEILFERYPAVRPMFGRKSAENQAKMLQSAIVSVMDHIDDATWLSDTLGAMGAKHIDYGVKDHMYPWVGECLVATLGEIAGADWTPEHAAAWGDAYGAIAGLMIAGAHRVREGASASV